MKLYRVFPWNASAAQTDPGGALYRPMGGAGRIDNPALYSVFYAADYPEAAIAERFGRLDQWLPAMLDAPRSNPDSIFAIGTYELAEPPLLIDLDNAHILTRFGLKPSDVVTRDYFRSQQWAARIYESLAPSDRGEGLKWWSYYNGDWGSYGLWSLDRLTLENVEALHYADPRLRRAATTISRQMQTSIR